MSAENHRSRMEDVPAPLAGLAGQSGPARHAEPAGQPGLPWPTGPSVQARESLEARVARRLAAALAEHAEAVPHEVGERLRVARQQALMRGRIARREAQAARAEEAVRIGGAPGAGAVFGRRRQARWERLAASLLPLLVLLLGLAAVERFAERERVLAAAEIDAQLLADDLPPAAYTDAGFVEFLRSPP